MPSNKKKLKEIIAAVSSIMGDGRKAKELKKAKALKRFISKLEDTLEKKEKLLASGKPTKKESARLSEQVEELSKQIKKARQVLDDLS